MDKRKEIRNYLESHLDIAIDIARECNYWDGSFEYTDTWDIEELCQSGIGTYEIVRAVIYGNVRNVCDDVRYDAYGNLETVDEVDLEVETKEYYLDDIVDTSMDLYEQGHIDINDDELKELYDYEFVLEDEAQKVYEEAENHYKGSEINADTLMRVAQDFFEYSEGDLEELEEYFKEQEELYAEE